MRHHRQVLGDEQPQGHPAVQGGELAGVEHLDRDDGAGQGEQGPEEEPGAEGEAEQGGEQGAEGHRAQDLQQPADAGDPAQAAQLGQGQLGADGEHQEGDADLGQGLDGVGVDPRSRA